MIMPIIPAAVILKLIVHEASDEIINVKEP